MLQFFKKILGLETAFEIRQKIDDGAFLVDVRTPTEFDAGHVKGSSNIPIDRIILSLEKFKDKKHIIVFCRSGSRSAQAKSILKSNGFSNVTNGGTWQSINSIIKSKG